MVPRCRPSMALGAAGFRLSSPMVPRPRIRLRARGALGRRLLPCLLLFATAPGSAGRATDLAVVLGIDRYAAAHWRDLDNARRGAEAVAHLLRERGFEVRPLYDEAATRRAVILLLERVAKEVRPRDRVLIYFAGHGHTEAYGEQRRGFIVPHDGRDVAAYISMKELQDFAAKIPAAQHLIFLMDSCYSGFIGAKTRSGAGPPSFLGGSRALWDLHRSRSRLFITAGGKDQRVTDGRDGRYSLFTEQLLEAIGGGKADLHPDGYITIAELTAYLETAASNFFQTPRYGQLHGDEGGSFLFKVRPGSPDPAPPPEDGAGAAAGALRSPLPPPGPTLSSPRRASSPIGTYTLREGQALALEELGLTAAVIFGKAEGYPHLQIVLEGADGFRGRQTAFDKGARLRFEGASLSLFGTLLDVDWQQRTVLLTLGLRSPEAKEPPSP